MIRNALLGSVAAIALSGSAFAADLPAKKAPLAYAPPVFTWTGFYVGGSVGLIDSTTKLSDVDGAIYSSGATARTASNGGIFGVNAGYNYQTGAFVFGLETDIALTTAKSTIDAYNDGQFLWGSKFTALGTLRARAGYAVDRALFYVTGGLAYGQVKNFNTNYADAYYSSSSSSWKTGWTLGGGIEYAVTPNWTVRAEALYVDLGKKTNTICQGGCALGFKNTAVVARVGVNYKF